MWVATAELPKSPGHPFYTRLNALLDADDFDRFVEGKCTKFYAPVMGRPSLAPGRYFRLLLVGYFEGIDSERGIAWRATDSLAVRSFLRLPVDEPPPDHSTISRTRRAIDLESHRAVFTWVQQRLVEAGLLKGKTVAVTRGTTQDIAITKLAPEAKIVRYEDDPVTMLALDQKKADVMPTAEVIALKKVKENKEMEIKGLVTRSWSAIGVRRGDPDWVQWLNTFMDWHGGQGKFAEMFEKWTGVEMPPALPIY